MRATRFLKLFALCLPLALAGQPAFAKKMYRWVDDNGNVYFSDQVPPDQVKHQRETLSDKVRVLEITEKAKTAEQLEQQKRLEALRREQEKIVAKQAANDKVLLSTFRTLDDMNRTLENKLAALDIEQKVIEGNIKRFELQLMRQQQQAADDERNARKVPDKLLADIATSKQQIEETKQELQRHLAERERTEKEFKADMARFQFLTDAGNDNKAANKSLVDSNAANIIGLFVCQDADQCEQAWKIAGTFVAERSTTSPDVETNKLIMRAPPIKDTDFSLSASKIDQNGQQLIFLDIRCKQSTLGAELCAGSKAQAIRQEFAPYIQQRLTPQ